MTTFGQVRIWHADDGWGVLDSADTPGGCWTHFSSLLVDGYRRLRAGHDVTFTFEVAEQDGFSFRAIEAWPSDQEPVREANAITGSSAAMESTLTLSFGEPAGAD